ncbi:MAG TPA: DUF2723 domain-containing protein [Polyangia bacterium]|nr:DUF2723 domain-containing protein [Polyangia bacterium]
MAPDVYWLDSSELAAAAWQLGVAHPPGHPLPSLLGRACALVPLGSIALRVGLASALAGAAAAAQTARLGALVARRARRPAQSDARIDGLVGAAAGLAFALSYAAAFQAVRPEVYALSALLVVTAAYELARYDETGDRRRVYTAALASGLALSNHHLLALTFVVPAALLFATGVGARTSLRALAVAALGLGMWCYLPLRAARHPLVNWGAPTTFARIFWTVSARAFQKAVARGQTSDIAGVAGALAAELWLVGALAALAGAYVLARLGRVRLALLLLGAALADAATPALVGFDPANPDAYGYLEAAVALLAALACAFPAVIAATVQRPRVARVSCAALVVTVVIGGASGFTRWSRARFWDTGATLGHFVDAAPPRALVVTSDFQTIFGLWYLAAVEGRRPDVDIVHRHFLAYPGYRDEIVHAHPELAPLLGAHDVIVPQLVSREPRVVQYDLDLDRSLAASAVIVPMMTSLDEPQTLRFAAWQAFLAAHQACTTGVARQAALTRARALLSLPTLNCDRIADPSTLGSP